MSWLGFTGLLRHTHIAPKRTDIHLDDLLYAQEIEPRIADLLPAILLHLRENPALDGTLWDWLGSLALLTKGACQY